MPLPLIPLIAGASALAGGGIDAISTGRQNRKSREFSREMYERQKQDNLSFWNLQNEYNSPQSQMNRFQEAGLNPNLIYGQGNSGNSGSVQTPDVQSPQFRTPEYGRAVSAGGLSVINAIYDLDIKAAQADNLRAQNTVIEQDALLRAAQIAQTRISTSRGEFDLNFETQFRDISADAKREDLRQTKAFTDIALRKDVRDAALNSTSIAEAFSRMQTAMDQRAGMALSRSQTIEETRRIKAEVARINQNIQLMKQDGTLKSLDIELRKQGINPQDPMWARIIGRLLARATDFMGVGDNAK